MRHSPFAGQVLGYKSKIILGYRGTSDVRGALDRNELQGMVQPWPNWVRDHFLKPKIVTLQIQFGYERLVDLPKIPTMVGLARTDDERRMDDPKDGVQLKKLIDDVLATPKPLVDKVRLLLGYK